MEILTALREKGPLTGRELYDITGADLFDLWRRCKRDEKVSLEGVGHRYLRFDRNIEGYARLSPSIQREFFTYTVIGLRGDDEGIADRAEAVGREIESISRGKLDLAREMVGEVLEKLPGLKAYILENACFIIGGDVPLGMAHDDPRPEVSTGILVSGSDLDIVAITVRDFNPEALKDLDEGIHEMKYRLLKRPHNKVEIDYVIKSIAKVADQAKLRAFEDLVACKIIEESEFLLGNPDIYEKVKGIMREHGDPQKLADHEEAAKARRKAAEKLLLEKEEVTEDDLKLFATSEEFEEIF
jgi:hypothetical protein